MWGCAAPLTAASRVARSADAKKQTHSRHVAASTDHAWHGARRGRARPRARGTHGAERRGAPGLPACHRARRRRRAARTPTAAAHRARGRPVLRKAARAALHARHAPRAQRTKSAHTRAPRRIPTGPVGGARRGACCAPRHTLRHTLRPPLPPAPPSIVPLAPLRVASLGIARIAHVPHDHYTPHAVHRTLLCYVGALGRWWRCPLGDTPAPPVPLGTPAAAAAAPPPPAAAHDTLYDTRARLRTEKRAQDQTRYAQRRTLRTAEQSARAAAHAADAARAAHTAATHRRAAARAALDTARAAHDAAHARLAAVRALSAHRRAVAAATQKRVATSARADVGRAEELREEIAALRRIAALLRTPRRSVSLPGAEWDAPDAAALLPSNLLSSADDEWGAHAAPAADVPSLATSPDSAVSRTPPTPTTAREPRDYWHAKRPAAPAHALLHGARRTASEARGAAHRRVRVWS
ncbi:hypothetical protein GLX27_004186 [Malassezia furfur]|uniref:Uncharacterized protein n=1 Tax=Malassezia furfur TaxID=55194 RepID=A0ABY8F137_MALFU|nr:hypothetical protein GLX27_004186 [Malassezia furfur]